MFNWLKDKKGAGWETFKFALRIFILVGVPQLLALATDHPGAWWANVISSALPLIDKAWHESGIEGNGLLPF